MVADDAQKNETGGEVVSGDAGAGLPGGSHHGHAGGEFHPVADLVEWAADLVEPAQPKLRD